MFTAKNLWTLVFGALFVLGMTATGCKTEEVSTCTVLDGQCPNFCSAGGGVQNETCTSTANCGCGLFCDGTSGTCQPYGGDNAGCSCSAPGDEPDVVVDTYVDTGPDLSCNGQPAPKGATCNPFCQIGCEEGEQCTFANSNILCDGIGDLAIGEECANSYECQQGMACFQLNSDPVKTCRQFCQTDSDCPSDRKCTLNVNFNNGDFEAKFCSEPIVGCSVFDDQCGDGQACYYSNSATKCMPEGTKQKDEVCHGSPANACAKGLQCLITCREPCSTDGGNADAPKCADVCGEGQDDTKELSKDNGLGVCVPDEPPATCDIFTQEGCGNSEGCYSVTGGFACVNAGSGKPGETCSSGNDCQKGSLCINQVCSEICSLNEEDKGKETHCEEKCSDNGQLSPAKWGVGFCKDAEVAKPCDFWAQDCSNGETCYATNAGATCMQTGGSVTEGEACQFIQDCTAGLICAGSKCVKPCSIADFPEGLCKPLVEDETPKKCEETSDCGDGETCTSEQWPADGLNFCEAACSANGKEIQPIVQGEIGYCKE